MCDNGRYDTVECGLPSFRRDCIVSMADRDCHVTLSCDIITAFGGPTFIDNGQQMESTHKIGEIVRGNLELEDQK